MFKFFFVVIIASSQVRGGPQIGLLWPPLSFQQSFLDRLVNEGPRLDTEELYHPEEVDVFVENKEETTSCDPQQGRVRCYNESSLALCSPSGHQRIVPCRRPTPRCNPNLNICTVGPNNSTSLFTCPEEGGYYPDPSSCRRFHFCSANKTSYPYTCDWPQVYDPKSKSCLTQSFRVPCYRFQCRGKQGRYTPYPGEPNIYTLCSGNAATVQFRCPMGQAMIESAQKCQPYCDKEGLMAGESCNSFYSCNRGMSGFRVTPGTCPPGSWFDPELSYCSILEDPNVCPEAFSQPTSSTTASTSTEGSSSPSSTSVTTTTEDSTSPMVETTTTAVSNGLRISATEPSMPDAIIQSETVFNVL